MESIWIKRGVEPIECVVIGTSKSVATKEGVKKMLKVRKVSACPHCTFDIREDEIITIAEVLSPLNTSKRRKD